MEIFSDPHFWVALSFVLFIALVYKKASRYLLRQLDDRSHKIQIDLTHAERLRREAEMLLEEYKQKQARYMQEASAMLEEARKDALLLAEHAERELKISLEARMQQALEKIAQSETQAIAEVRSRVVDVALSSARSLISEQMDAKKSSGADAFLQAALSDITRKLH